MISEEIRLDILGLCRGLMPTWLELWDLLAFIDQESGFDRFAERFEPKLNERSYGLMQLLLSTARQLDFTGPPDGLFEPTTNIALGIRYLGFIREYLEKNLKRPPSETEWVEAYNEGIGNVMKGRADPGYYASWSAKRDYWKRRICGMSEHVSV